LRAAIPWMGGSGQGVRAPDPESAHQAERARSLRPLVVRNAKTLYACAEWTERAAVEFAIRRGQRLPVRGADRPWVTIQVQEEHQPTRMAAEVRRWWAPVGVVPLPRLKYYSQAPETWCPWFQPIARRCTNAVGESMAGRRWETIQVTEDQQKRGKPRKTSPLQNRKKRRKEVPKKAER